MKKLFQVCFLFCVFPLQAYAVAPRDIVQQILSHKNELERLQAECTKKNQDCSYISEQLREFENSVRKSSEILRHLEAAEADLLKARGIKTGDSRVVGFISKTPFALGPYQDQDQAALAASTIDTTSETEDEDLQIGSWAQHIWRLVEESQLEASSAAPSEGGSPHRIDKKVETKDAANEREINERIKDLLGRRRIPSQLILAYKIGFRQLLELNELARLKKESISRLYNSRDWFANLFNNTTYSPINESPDDDQAGPAKSCE